MNFATAVTATVDSFRSLALTAPLRIISNKDTDGITAASILIAAFRNTQQPTVTTFIKQITEDFLDTLTHESSPVYFFLDMGASTLDLLSKKLPNKIIFVLDHHFPASSPPAQAHLVHLNPHLYGVDGTKNISAAGIAYLFAKAFDEHNIYLAPLALVGAVGDMQEHFGFIGFNETILEDALAIRAVTLNKGLRFFGVHTKPLHKFLEYTTNPYIPSVTGSEKGALQFLKSLGINPKHGDTYKWISDLSQQDIEKLTSALLSYYASPPALSSFYGQLYFLAHEPRTSPTHDIVEYSTLLNACGKMGQPSLGVGVCLGDAKAREKALHLVSSYTHEILSCLTWFYKHRGTPAVVEHNNSVFINAENAIRDGLIGTLVSLLSKSNIYPEGTILIGFASMLSDEMKVSTRICGFRDSPFDLRALLDTVIQKTGGQSGGHRLAAGATFPSVQLQEFLNECSTLLQKPLLEEPARTL